MKTEVVHRSSEVDECVDPLDPVWPRRRVRIPAEDGVAKCGEMGGDHPADPANARNANRVVGRRLRKVDAVEIPMPTLGVAGVGDESAGASEHERNRVCRDLVDAIVGDVGDGDVARGSSIEVNVVEPDPVAHERGEFRQSSQQRVVDSGPLNE